jgi:2-isopropylmalate synthase
VLKPDFADRFEPRITPEALEKLTAGLAAFDELLNRSHLDRQAPYVGESAFATKAGIHASAILKDPETYEHMSA